MKTLILDNYDSFTYNLYQYIGELQGNPIIYQNDKISLSKIEKLKPTHIIISPGPGTPEKKEDFGVCLKVILKLGPKIPILGVCLGHQGICFAFGGKTINAPEIMHGKESLIYHKNQGIFRGIKNPFSAMRYHSLMTDPKTFPKVLNVTAYTSYHQNQPKSSIIPKSVAKKTLFAVSTPPTLQDKVEKTICLGGVASQSRRAKKIDKQNSARRDENEQKDVFLPPTIIMGLQHKKHPIFGVQFHPESIATPEGKKILKNFLATFNL